METRVNYVTERTCYDHLDDEVVERMNLEELQRYVEYLHTDIFYSERLSAITQEELSDYYHLLKLVRFEARLERDIRSERDYRKLIEERTEGFYKFMNEMNQKYDEDNFAE